MHTIDCEPESKYAHPVGKGRTEFSRDRRQQFTTATFFGEKPMWAHALLRAESMRDDARSADARKCAPRREESLKARAARSLGSNTALGIFSGLAAGFAAGAIGGARGAVAGGLAGAVVGAAAAMVAPHDEQSSGRKDR